MGFPKKKSEALALFESYKFYDVPIVFFDSPKRLLKSLMWLNEHVQISYCCVGKELTKLYETVISGSLCDVIDKCNKITLKGEFCFVLKD